MPSSFIEYSSSVAYHIVMCGWEWWAWRWGYTHTRAIIENTVPIFRLVHFLLSDPSVTPIAMSSLGPTGLHHILLIPDFHGLLTCSLICSYTRCSSLSICPFIYWASCWSCSSLSCCACTLSASSSCSIFSFIVDYSSCLLISSASSFILCYRFCRSCWLFLSSSLPFLPAVAFATLIFLPGQWFDGGVRF